MLDVVLQSFTTLFVVIDPLGLVPVLLALTPGLRAPERRRMALKGTLIAAVILLGFALAGEPVLALLGIGLPAFRTAGGVMLLLIALEMVFERRTARRESRAQEVNASPEHEDISVFPMAIPMIAGPGSIASAMLWVWRADDAAEVATVLAAITVLIAITLATLLAAGPLMRLLGDRIEAMITRILGVILAALAAQFVIDGLRESFPGL